MWTGIHCKLPVVDWLRSNIDYLDWPHNMLHTKGRFKKAISTEPKPTHWPFLSALQPLVTLSVLLNTTQGRGSEFLQRQQQNLKIPYIPFHPKTGKKSLHLNSLWEYWHVEAWIADTNNCILTVPQSNWKHFISMRRQVQENAAKASTPPV